MRAATCTDGAARVVLLACLYLGVKMTGSLPLCTESRFGLSLL